MKKITWIVALLLLPLAMMGQNYDKMWREVEKADQDDLPRTAIERVEKIISVASQKGHNDQLAKALINKMLFAETLAPDSAEALLPQVEKICRSRKGAADRAVYQALLGWLYNCRSTLTDPQTKNKALLAFREAIADPAALANAKSDTYIAILSKGDDSQYYNHDLLSVVFPFVARQLCKLPQLEADSLAHQVMASEIKLYADRQMREATMLAKMDSASILNEDGHNFYKQIVADYGDMPLSTMAYAWLCRHNGTKRAYELANEALSRHPKTTYTNYFKNVISKAEQPVLSLYTNDINTYPGESVRLIYNYKNVRNATLRYYRLPYSATDREWLGMKEKDYPTLAQNPDYSQTLTLRRGEPYEYFKDTTTIVVPQPGLYLVEISGSDFKTSYSVVRVSRLAVMQVSLPEQKVRISIADYKSGKPVPHATVQLRITRRDSVSWQQYSTDGRGELTLPNVDGDVSIFVSTEDDKALASVSMAHSYDYAWNRTESNTYTRIYTDRAIYRPGQQVRIGGFIYNKVDDSTHVIADASLDLEIRDANYKKLQTITVVSDRLGAFSADFTLPQECLNGTFSVRSSFGYASFKVEEYKRPKFKVTIDKPNAAFTLGDTVMVSGEVKTYSGLPLDNTTLYCSVDRQRSWWLRYSDFADKPHTARNTIQTDAEGRFTLPVVLSQPKISESSEYYWRPLCYSYSVNVKATADDGETEEASLRLYAGNVKAYVSVNAPSVICKEQMPALSATQTNSMGEPVSGEGKYLLVQDKDTLQRGTLQFNQPRQLDFIATLPSGQYTLIVFPTDDDNKYHAAQSQFTLLSLADTKPVGTEPLQVWQSSNEFSYTEPVDVLVATPLKEAWLHCDIMANDRLVDSQIISLSDTVTHLSLKWHEEYGRGANVLLAIYSQGKLYNKSLLLTKPLPDKTLDLRWTTFRDKLLPGSAETWTLQVLRHGQPAEASVLATMYDASLDKFGKHYLPLSLSYNRYIPQQLWNSSSRELYSANLAASYSSLRESTLRFTRLSSLFNQNPFEYHRYSSRLNGAIGNLMRLEERPLMAMAKSASVDALATADAEEEAVEEEEDITANVELRTNFNETAFFTSTLRTDAKGQAVIEFKLPESLTSWNFKALAHTTDLCYGRLDTLITVQKPFMVQANMPRFLRSGDKTSLAITVRNNSQQTQGGKAQLVLIDAQSGEQVKLLSQPFSVEPAQTTTLNFPIEASDEQPMLICRYAAISDEFSDGEQQYLPVLSDLQKTISTVSFMVNDGQTHTVALDSLHYNPAARHSLLTVEYTGNPAWTTISALPSTVNYQTRCATQLAINYSALTLMRQIIADNPQISQAIRDWQQADSVPTIFAQLQNNPELKIAALDQTPWVRSADREQNRLNALAQDDQTLSLKQASMLHKLREMQTADGGWQWFPGMPSSTWLTLDIAEMLSRTRALCPSASADIDPMLAAALRHLDAKASEAAATLKKNKAKYVPTMWMRYLYVVSKTDGQFNTAARKYLVSHLQQSSTQYDLYDKAMAAVILQKAKPNGKQAALTLKSLLEYTVSRPETGRYFDSRRASGSWSMYKIPTQVAAIEAVQALISSQTRCAPREGVSRSDGGVGANKQTLDEMRLWLLQSKHTQMWEQPLAATQAIGCLLSSGMLAAPTALPAQLDLNLANSEIMPVQEYADIDPFVQLGYVKAAISDKELSAAPATLTVRQSAATVEQPLSYGAAYLQSWQPALETPAAGTELSLSWQLYKETAAGWQAISSPSAREGVSQSDGGVGVSEPLAVGDRVMVRYDIRAERDFDFVALRDGRPACLEPTSTASGYSWSSGCYRSVEDDGTFWYFDRLSKGHHVIEETYNVDRLGQFSSACPQVQCQYAPEFAARAKAIVVTVK